MNQLEKWQQQANLDAARLASSIEAAAIDLSEWDHIKADVDQDFMNRLKRGEHLKDFLIF